MEFIILGENLTSQALKNVISNNINSISCNSNIDSDFIIIDLDDSISVKRLSKINSEVQVIAVTYKSPEEAILDNYSLNSDIDNFILLKKPFRISEFLESVKHSKDKSIRIYSDPLLNLIYFTYKSLKKADVHQKLYKSILKKFSELLPSIENSESLTFLEYFKNAVYYYFVKLFSEFFHSKGNIGLEGIIADMSGKIRTYLKNTQRLQLLESIDRNTDNLRCEIDKMVLIEKSLDKLIEIIKESEYEDIKNLTLKLKRLCLDIKTHSYELLNYISSSTRTSTKSAEKATDTIEKILNCIQQIREIREPLKEQLKC